MGRCKDMVRLSASLSMGGSCGIRLSTLSGANQSWSLSHRLLFVVSDGLLKWLRWLVRWLGTAVELFRIVLVSLPLLKRLVAWVVQLLLP
jgi:hypothetical protein